MLTEPLKPQEARKLIQAILKGSTPVMSGHALEELEKDKLIIGDVVNVLRGGAIDPAEFENGSWRYRVRTNKIAVVVCFVSETELCVVTTWRFKK